MTTTLAAFRPATAACGKASSPHRGSRRDHPRATMTEGIDPREFYTLIEAGFLIHRAPTTLRNQIYNGKLKGRLIGSVYIVTGRELLRYAQETARKS
jgi:hypothetical protein